MRVVLTGGRGMLATAVADAWLAAHPDDDVIRLTRDDADLRDAAATRALIERVKPDLLIHAAARVGGIAANVADPTGFLMDNLLLDTSVLNASLETGVPRLIYIGSSCMYPRDYRQPLVESDMLAAPLEPTNEGYALAKIVAARFCAYATQQHGVHYKVIVPSNLYGPGDDYSAGTSHLVAAAIAKTDRARLEGAADVDVWGDGTARREFTYVEDIAGWLVSAAHSMDEWPEMLNVGAGVDHSVLDYYRAAAEVTGFEGGFRLQPDKPAGMHMKLMDSTEARAWGWNPSTTLEDGMKRAFAAYRATSERAER
jgi:GDP-L-fucose synthase